MTTEPVIIEPTAEHNSTLIFLHGLGDSVQNWSSALAAIRPPSMKVICPIAPSLPVTLTGGNLMPSWFDVITLNPSGPEDEEGIKSSSQNIQSMVNKEIENGIPSNRIILGGFSQGGALAIYSALTFNKPLAGVVSLSGYLLLHKHFPDYKTNKSDISIFLFHGDSDPVIPYNFGQRSDMLLKKIMKNVTFKTYKGLGHTSSEEEMNDIKDVLIKLLN